ncbi:S41 family peptidase [Kordiimonas pumila]|uniref:S41 family peptidase n=1 Tax=Kordiimonas pumila TaxID=2161677 RepID=A0ABV7D3B6_9PROT|nr:S41 family peptidase [Kordiimonas pumila]
MTSRTMKTICSVPANRKDKQYKQSRPLTWLFKFAGMALVVSGVLGGVFARDHSVSAENEAAELMSDVRDAKSYWQELYKLDVSHFSEIVKENYIYAVYTADENWNSLYRSAVDQAYLDASLVKDLNSYQAVMRRLIAQFEDAHLSVTFLAHSNSARWPGFLVRYQGGRYIVVKSSRTDIPEGSEIVSCDNRSINDWVDQLARFWGGPQGLDTTRAHIGPEVFIDRDSPFYERPKVCKTGDSVVELHWRDVVVTKKGKFPTDLDELEAQYPHYSDHHTGLSSFGENGAWVRMARMYVENEDQAEAWHKIIDAASGLRDKDFVVIDVRGNSGGTYNWFMAFLRSFYGDDYIDYYARARLVIENVLLAPEGAKGSGMEAPPETSNIKMPVDPPMADIMEKPTVETLETGARLIRLRKPIDSMPPLPDEKPISPVSARVYVLTDYGCASACLSFLDEIMRIPGVIQIGGESHIDRRSAGWPSKYHLASGLAYVNMGRLVRVGRARGENAVWRPHYRFSGNLGDTEAVKKWILTEVIPDDFHRERPEVHNQPVTSKLNKGE